MPKITLIVPCHNEERRLDTGEYKALLEDAPLSLLFVDDGSSDGTSRVIEALREGLEDQIALLVLVRNVGKAEAVRQGLLKATREGAEIVGFIDADFATPRKDVLNLLDTLRKQQARVVIGSRVALSGRQIDRTWLRHYLGRVFSTAASLILQTTIYDTQCGAKLFKNTEALRAAIATRFNSNWAFDVELLGRLLIGSPEVEGLDCGQIVEVPLERWRDVGGSKLNFRGMAQAGLDLFSILRALTKMRRDKCR